MVKAAVGSEEWCKEKVAAHTAALARRRAKNALKPPKAPGVKRARKMKTITGPMGDTIPAPPSSGPKSMNSKKNWYNKPITKRSVKAGLATDADRQAYEYDQMEKKNFARRMKKTQKGGYFFDSI